MKSTFLLLATLLLLAVSAQAQVPNLVNYQGRISVGATNFTGTGQFKFVLTDKAGDTYYWTNDGTGSPSSPPTNAVSVTVSKGLYSVLLGDTTLTNMTAIPTSVWANPDVRLRVFFSDGVNTSQQLTPDQRLAPTGYLASGLTLAGTTSVSGDLNLPVTTAAGTGVLDIGGAPFLHAYGHGGLSDGNTFVGDSAGNFTLTGIADTATGSLALLANTNGSYNTADGYAALYSNTMGNDNTASGFDALNDNTMGSYNTASGTSALYSNITGSMNTASGYAVLYNNTGSNNTASGFQALAYSTGNSNIALGSSAGFNLTTGSNNIDIGSGGVAGESNIIRIGDGSTQTATYLTGKINGDGSGLTGITSSSLASNLTLAGTTSLSGDLNLPATSSTSTGVLDIGGSAFLHAYGKNGLSDGNTFVGNVAGNFTLTGTSNTAEGYQSLRANTMGSSNTASGYAALNGNTTGSNNTASGSGALFGNALGGNNTASGYDALNGNTMGSNNSANGSSALYKTTGSNNIALGSQAGYNLTTGSNNIDLGSQGVAGESNIIRLGDGSTQTDTYLTGNVHLTGTIMAPAAGATIDGSNLLRLTNTSMDGNTTTPDFVGIAFGQSGTRQAIVGGTYGNDYLDFYTGGALTTPKMRINNAGNVGIGTASPAAKLDISGSENVSGALTTGSATVSGALTTGSATVSGAFTAGSTTAGVSLNGRTGIGSAAAANCALNVQRFGSTEFAAQFVAESGVTFLQIGLNDGVALYVNRATGLIERSDFSSTWDTSSDERIKHDIKPVAGALATLERLRPVRFHYNADFLAKQEGSVDYERFGVVAQEFQKVFPDFVDTNADGMLSVRMDPIPIVTAAAVQELDAEDKKRDARIDALEKKNVTGLSDLQAENAALKKRLGELEVANKNLQDADKARDARLARLEQLLPSK